MVRVPDRPLRRGLIKVLFRILLGARRAHYQDWFPWLSLDLPSHPGKGEIRYKGKHVAKLLGSMDVLDPAVASEIIVIGSGPSVSDADLGLIGRETVVLLNGAVKLCSSHGLEPVAVVVEDERFVWRHFDMMKANISPYTAIFMSPAVIRAVCERDKAWLSGKRIVLVDSLRKPYRFPKREYGNLVNLPYVRMACENTGLSLSPDQGVFQAGSVAVTALQYALFWHPKKISFLGVDINSANLPRFYENASSYAYSGVLGAKQRILDHFRLGFELANEHGIDMVTYSANSALREIGIPFSDRLAKA